MPLTQIYPQGRAISIAKKNDLLKLLKYIPPINHDFYNSLSVMSGEKDFYADENLENSEIGEEFENIHQNQFTNISQDPLIRTGNDACELSSSTTSISQTQSSYKEGLTSKNVISGMATRSKTQQTKFFK